MNKSKELLVLGLIGFTIFYLIASGCASFDFGGIKKQVEGKLDLCPNTTIQSIYLTFVTQTRKDWFENGLRNLIVKNGYQLVDDAAKADLELKIEYSSLVKKKKNVGIVFLIPFFSSYNVEGFNVKSTFTTNKCSRNKIYRAEHQFEISSAIVSDLKQLESKTGGEHGKENL